MSFVEDNSFFGSRSFISLSHIKRLFSWSDVIRSKQYNNVMNNIVHLRKGFQLPWRYTCILKSEYWNHKSKAVSVCFRLGIHLHCHFLHNNVLLKVSVEPLL
jgi:hypothetical protein